MRARSQDHYSAAVLTCCAASYSNLRAKLYKESFEFVRQQRIHCLLEGAWFMNGIPLATTVPRDTLKRPTRPWRFLRLVGTRNSHV